MLFALYFFLVIAPLVSLLFFGAAIFDGMTAIWDSVFA